MMCRFTFIVFLALGCPYNAEFTDYFGQSRLVYEWTTLDFVWPSSNDRSEALRSGSFIPERNLIAGIKVYKDTIYLTIPRWRWVSGQPATLTKVVEIGGQAKLEPYPSWAEQKVGDCNALQYVQSMEVDTNTGLMYVIDTGRVGIRGNETTSTRCPAKIVVFNLETDQKVSSYELPESFVSSDNFLNDIVLQYVNGKVKYAYMSDVIEGRLHVFDFDTLMGRNFEDQSMKPEPNNGTVIRVNGVDYNYRAGLDGIAMSYDFKYIYYCPLGGYNVYQLPTASLTSAETPKPRLLGRKISQSDGLTYGIDRLYYGALGLNAVYFWSLGHAMRVQGLPGDKVVMEQQSEVVRGDMDKQWPDTFAWDDQGYLYFVSNRLHLFNSNTMDFSGHDRSNMRVWKVWVNDTSYLYQANFRTEQSIVG
ncbi:protein yellow [Biomphalaria glabrata]|nr:protein yellow-like [Biomphalaria glabrata]